MTKLAAAAAFSLILLTWPAMAQTPQPGAGGVTPPILSSSGGAAPVLGGAPAAPKPPTQIQQQPSAAAPLPPQNAAPVAPAPSTNNAAATPAASPNVSASAATSAEGGVLTAYGDWSTQCFSEPINGLKCQILQRVVSAQGGQVVLVVALVADPKSDETDMQVAVPLGVLVDSGSQILVGNEYQNDVAVSRCTQQGCIIEGKVTEDLLAAMRREASASVIVLNEAKEQIPIRFSLMGFTDAYAAMLAANGGQ